MQLNNLKTEFLGQNNIYYKEIDSTQSEIWRMYEKGCPNGSLVMAGVQTSGKGTHGRVWHTNLENNIAFSFLIRLDCNIKKLDGLTIEIAEILTSIIKDKYNIQISIKEPNDLVYNKKKLGGILTETKIVKETVKALVIGIGINTSQKEFPEDIKDIATSIAKEFNININVKEFIEEFCFRFEKRIMERTNK